MPCIAWCRSPHMRVSAHLLKTRQVQMVRMSGCRLSYRAAFDAALCAWNIGTYVQRYACSCSWLQIACDLATCM